MKLKEVKSEAEQQLKSGTNSNFNESLKASKLANLKKYEKPEISNDFIKKY